MTQLIYDHSQYGRYASPLRTPDLLRREPAYVGPIGELPLELRGVHTFKVAALVAADQGPGRLSLGEVVSGLGETLIIATVLNGRDYFQNWAIVFGTVDEFNCAGTLVGGTDRGASLGPALLMEPLFVTELRKARGDSSYKSFERRALEVAGAQLYLSERVIVGASGLTERASTASGAYERLSPELTPLRSLLRGGDLTDASEEAEEGRLRSGEIGPDDPVYTFLRRAGAPRIKHLYAPLYGRTTKSIGHAWLSAVREATHQSAQASVLQSCGTIECLSAAIRLAVSALGRHPEPGELRSKSIRVDDSHRRVLAINSATIERLITPDIPFHEGCHNTRTSIDMNDKRDLGIFALTKLAFFWDADPVLHLPHLSFWSSHFAAARFLGRSYRSPAEGKIALPPAAHWGLHALSSPMFESILDPGTREARNWLRSMPLEWGDIHRSAPDWIGPGGEAVASWIQKPMRRAKGRP